MSTPVMADGPTRAASAARAVVSVVVPTLNEAPNLEPLCAALWQALGESCPSYEVIFVDDASSDGTAEAAQKLERETGGRVRLLARHGQRSLSGAVIDGFAAATADILVVMDADLQHPPEVVPQLLAAIAAGADLVVASRYAPGGNSELGPYRNLFSRACTALVRVCLGRRFGVSDPLSGFFALRRSVTAGSRLSPSGFKILLEVLACGNYRDVREVPFRFVQRMHGASKLGLATALSDLRGLMRATREFRRRRSL